MDFGNVFRAKGLRARRLVNVRPSQIIHQTYADRCGVCVGVCVWLCVLVCGECDSIKLIAGNGKRVQPRIASAVRF